jgi:hypothetical protein
MTQEQLISNDRQTAQKWREHPDLIRKNYLYDGSNANTHVNHVTSYAHQSRLVDQGR